MILIKPDHERRIQIAGVSAPVLRPVEIDQSMTGFTSLRTLRIYRFVEGALIEGHAEEDEVFIVVLSGSVDLIMMVDGEEDLGPTTLSAPINSASLACAAYLPPNAAYKLLATGDADVAYARATPASARSPKLFFSLGREDMTGLRVLFEETSHAERLRIRLVHFNTRENDLTFQPIDEAEAMCEGLIHFGTAHSHATVARVRNQFASILLDAWDTAVAKPGELPVLSIPQGSSGLALVVMAS